MPSAEEIHRAVLTSARTCTVCGIEAPVSEPDVRLCATHEALRANQRRASAAACLDAPSSHP